ncbi:MAG: hypothetical protein MHPSP_004483, partial [Paramarteilia canceri]
IILEKLKEKKTNSHDDKIEKEKGKENYKLKVTVLNNINTNKINNNKNKNNFIHNNNNSESMDDLLPIKETHDLPHGTTLWPLKMLFNELTSLSSGSELDEDVFLATSDSVSVVALDDNAGSTLGQEEPLDLELGFASEPDERTKTRSRARDAARKWGDATGSDEG